MPLGPTATLTPPSGYQLKISPIWRQALLLASAAPKKSICLLLSSARHSPKEHGPHFTRLPQSTYCHERVIVVSASTTGPGSLRSVAFDAAVQAQVQENSVGLGKAGKPRTPSKRSNALGTPVANAVYFPSQVQTPVTFVRHVAFCRHVYMWPAGLAFQQQSASGLIAVATSPRRAFASSSSDQARRCVGSAQGGGSQLPGSTFDDEQHVSRGGGGGAGGRGGIGVESAASHALSDAK